MNKSYDCKSFEVELPDLVLTPGAKASPAAVAHMRGCPPCADEFLSFQKTFAALDTWTVPAPSAYFDQRLTVRIREEQAAPRMSFFERMQARLLFNTGRNFRPAMAGALALALLAGTGSLVEVHSLRTAPPPLSATVNDLQILDRNEQAFQQLDELQQPDEDNVPASQAPDADAGSPTT